MMYIVQVTSEYMLTLQNSVYIMRLFTCCLLPVVCPSVCPWLKIGHKSNCNRCTEYSLNISYKLIRQTSVRFLSLLYEAIMFSIKT